MSGLENATKQISSRVVSLKVSREGANWSGNDYPFDCDLENWLDFEFTRDVLKLMANFLLSFEAGFGLGNSITIWGWWNFL